MSDYYNSDIECDSIEKGRGWLPPRPYTPPATYKFPQDEAIKNYRKKEAQYYRQSDPMFDGLWDSLKVMFVPLYVMILTLIFFGGLFGAIYCVWIFLKNIFT